MISGTVQQPYGRIERCRTQVHVPLRRRQIAMSGELLDSPRRRATHRQVRTEGVTEYVNTSALEIRHPRGAAHMIRNDLRRHECPIRLTEHAR